ncbi:endonuclease IV [Deltaproteobacteria bacterium Smac51]|nr:endonuclease IV [Deltaproteobacteria bacterium Smac51]
MLHIGCHLSSSKGFLAMGKEALKIKADTFQFFTRNPRGSKAKELDPADAAALVELMKENHFAPVMAHAPYTLNPAAKDGRVREFALEVMADDLVRMEHLPGAYYNFHPGSHVGQGLEKGLELIAGLLNNILNGKQGTLVLLETMAGKGSEIGGRFEEIRAIIDRVERQEQLGVCLDTCHVHEAGYDIVNDLDGVLKEFDDIIGLARLKAIHLNDSLNGPGAHKDRHAKIGEGQIGLPAIVHVINHPALRHLPFYLETPNELDGYAAEIKLLREAYQEQR